MRGMGGMAGIGGLMKQAQQMQDRMKKAQEELADVEVDAGEGVSFDFVGEEDLGDAFEFDEGGSGGHGARCG